MKALLIKYHGPTNTKGSRLSVQSEGFKPTFVTLEPDVDIDDQKYILARAYFENRFCIKNPNFAIGTLPNGDDVAVLI
jgi:hypothetical protein